MLDRESTFADRQIVQLLKTRFVPVAIDQAYQRRQKDAEGRFYQKIANQGPRKVGQGTTQGLYVALGKYRPARVARIEKGRADPRFNPQPPKGGLVVRVNSKVLGGYEETDDRWRRIFQEATGRDNFWIRKDEHDALLNGKLADSMLRRLARYHLVDNTRGEPPMWSQTEIKSLDVRLKDGRLSGAVTLSTKSGDRAFEASLYGHVEKKDGKLSRFDVVASGRFRGEGRYTRNAPKGWFPFAVAFSLATGEDATDRIPPQGSRGWVDGYLRH